VTSLPNLIDQLVDDAKPVKRLKAPLLRASLFVAGVMVLLAMLVLFRGIEPGSLERLFEMRVALETAATAVTGAAAIFAAFSLAIPGRSRIWMVLPIPPLVMWLATSGYGCYRNWVSYGANGSLALGHSADCFAFILTASIPMALALFFALRRAHPLNPGPVLSVGALGVAGLAAAALQFFHPFDVTVTDLTLHAIAVGLVVALVTAIGKPRLRPSGRYDN
jgi:hypothetical protein